MANTSSEILHKNVKFDPKICSILMDDEIESVTKPVQVEEICSFNEKPNQTYQEDTKIIEKYRLESADLSLDKFVRNDRTESINYAVVSATKEPENFGNFKVTKIDCKVNSSSKKKSKLIENTKKNFKSSQIIG